VLGVGSFLLAFVGVLGVLQGFFSTAVCILAGAFYAWGWHLLCLRPCNSLFALCPCLVHLEPTCVALIISFAISKKNLKHGFNI
jgi:hypothetical protein